EYKQFEGLKLYSDIFKSEDEKVLINKRIYVTKKQNYVYYERTDVNWNYWSSERNYNSTFNPENDSKHNIIFEVSSELSDFIKYLGEEIIRKIELKQHNGEIVEILDI
ncbi:hypothetical protein HMPREF0380_00157, partial [Eubacterium infirmum F0142]